MVYSSTRRQNTRIFEILMFIDYFIYIGCFTKYKKPLLQDVKCFRNDECFVFLATILSFIDKDFYTLKLPVVTK